MRTPGSVNFYYWAPDPALPDGFCSCDFITYDRMTHYLGCWPKFSESHQAEKHNIYFSQDLAFDIYLIGLRKLVYATLTEKKLTLPSDAIFYKNLLIHLDAISKTPLDSLIHQLTTQYQTILRPLSELETKQFTIIVTTLNKTKSLRDTLGRLGAPNASPLSLHLSFQGMQHYFQQAEQSAKEKKLIWCNHIGSMTDEQLSAHESNALKRLSKFPGSACVLPSIAGYTPEFTRHNSASIIQRLLQAGGLDSYTEEFNGAMASHLKSNKLLSLFFQNTTHNRSAVSQYFGTTPQLLHEMVRYAAGYQKSPLSEKEKSGCCTC